MYIDGNMSSVVRCGEVGELFDWCQVRARLVAVVVMISPAPLPALYGHYHTENMPARHKKYTTVTWPTPLLPCNNCPACPALAVNIVLTARNSGKYFKLYVENISELFHDYKILFFLLVWYLPWNCFHFLAVSWVNNKMFSIWTEIFWC